jgi:hypothetical protein
LNQQSGLSLFSTVPLLSLTSVLAEVSALAVELPSVLVLAAVSVLEPEVSLEVEPEEPHPAIEITSEAVTNPVKSLLFFIKNTSFKYKKLFY